MRGRVSPEETNGGLLEGFRLKSKPDLAHAAAPRGVPERTPAERFAPRTFDGLRCSAWKALGTSRYPRAEMGPSHGLKASSLPMGPPHSPRLAITPVTTP